MVSQAGNREEPVVVLGVEVQAPKLLAGLVAEPVPVDPVVPDTAGAIVVVKAVRAAVVLAEATMVRAMVHRNPGAPLVVAVLGLPPELVNEA